MSFRSGNFGFSHASKGSSFTVYVDNLPNSVGIPWFRKFFSNFGYVVDSHLPVKRSRRTGNRFGFIRFDNRVEVNHAIAKANGLWIGKRSLIVERASYDFGNGYQKLSFAAKDFGNGYQKKSYADAINQIRRDPIAEKFGKYPKDADNLRTICVQPSASEWLSRSAVVNLFNITTTEMVQNAFTVNNFNEVLVRHLGGLDMIITFQSKEDRALALNNPVVLSWFKILKPWNGEVSGNSRLVWLKCRGMPLSAWGFLTFKRIGEIWGEFITLDEETLKEETFDVGRMLIATDSVNKIEDWINISVRGRNHRVRVREEECEDFFNEKIILDLATKHLLVNKIQSDLVDTSQKDDGDKEQIHHHAENEEEEDAVEDERPLGPSKSAVLELPKSAVVSRQEIAKEVSKCNALIGDKGVLVVKRNESVPLIEGGSGMVHHPKLADKNLETILEEEESFVGESPYKDNSNHVEVLEGIENSIPKQNRQEVIGPNNDAPIKLFSGSTVLTAKLKRAILRKEIRDICDSLDEGTQVGEVWEATSEHSDSINSEDIRRRNDIIIKGFEAAVNISKRLGVIHHESDEMVIKRMAHRHAQRHGETLNKRVLPSTMS